jgi:formiminotetrahydrofolate cyclodeaminase
MSYADETVVALLEQIAAATPAPASGTAAALTGALAAALVELAAGVSADEETRAQALELRVELGALADADAAAYTEFMRTRSEEARRRTIEVPQRIADASAAVGALGARLAETGKPSVAGDALAAVELGRGAEAAARRLVALNQAV